MLLIHSEPCNIKKLYCCIAGMAHNMSRYNGHLILWETAKKIKGCDFSFVVKNNEKPIFFRLEKAL